MKNIKMLIVERMTVDAEVIQRLLDRIEGWRTDLQICSETDFEAVVKSDASVILVDAETDPTFSLVKEMRKNGDGRPVIILHDDEHVPSNALGADDWLHKDAASTRTLHRAVVNAMEKYRLRVLLNEAYRDIKRVYEEAQKQCDSCRQDSQHDVGMIRHCLNLLIKEKDEGKKVEYCEVGLNCCQQLEDRLKK